MPIPSLSKLALEDRIEQIWTWLAIGPTPEVSDRQLKRGRLLQEEKTDRYVGLFRDAFEMIERQLARFLPLVDALRTQADLLGQLVWLESGALPSPP